MDLNKLVRVHIKIRDARAKLSEEFKASDAELKANQERIEGELLRTLQEQSVDSMRTEAGTFYRQEEIKPSASDWDAFYKWIAENDAFDALERRVKKDFVKAYMADHEGGLPPGISVHREYVARVRRA